MVLTTAREKTRWVKMTAVMPRCLLRTSFTFSGLCLPADGSLGRSAEVKFRNEMQRGLLRYFDANEIPHQDSVQLEPRNIVASRRSAALSKTGPEVHGGGRYSMTGPRESSQQYILSSGSVQCHRRESTLSAMSFLMQTPYAKKKLNCAIAAKAHT
ncbi:hypothetical protein GE09DRAFT_299104 [Coniochaeta sp. 2T2.1]|nr:hypothetical protein GE09DRAFT_299104 [Coniochaeta sp. 2T2.1]